MSMDESRRFTDEEVALVLRKASELEDHEFTGGSTGLSLRELEEVASEVGISRTVIHRAVTEMDAERRSRRAALGAPMVQRAIRAVPTELDGPATADLIRYVDAGSNVVGIVTEAQGSTRWTATDRFRSTQVSITPAKGETTILVVQRATSRLRRAVVAVPSALGVMITLGSIGPLDPSSGAVAALAAVGGALGGVVGSFIWRRLARGRAERVERLAGELSERAMEAARVQDGDHEDPPGPPRVS